jgi:hypothetical protein
VPFVTGGTQRPTQQKSNTRPKTPRHDRYDADEHVRLVRHPLLDFQARKTPASNKAPVSLVSMAAPIAGTHDETPAMILATFFS